MGIKNTDLRITKICKAIGPGHLLSVIEIEKYPDPERRRKIVPVFTDRRLYNFHVSQIRFLFQKQPGPSHIHAGGLFQSHDRAAQPVKRQTGLPFLFQFKPIACNNQKCLMSPHLQLRLRRQRMKRKQFLHLMVRHSKRHQRTDKLRLLPAYNHREQIVSGNLCRRLRAKFLFYRPCQLLL